MYQSSHKSLTSQIYDFQKIQKLADGSLHQETSKVPTILTSGTIQNKEGCEITHESADLSFLDQSEILKEV